MADEEKAFEEAIRGLVKEAPNTDDRHQQCPFCSGAFHKLHLHIRGKHPGRVAAMVEHPDLGVDAYSIMKDAEKELDAEAYTPSGLSVGENPDYDYLAFPREVTDEVNRIGAKMHWASPQRVEHYKNQGFKVYQGDRDTQGQMAHQHSREDTTLRTNEMVAMVVPREVRERREKMKRYRVEQQNDGLPHASDRAGALNDVGEQAYKYFRDNFQMSRDDAMMHARRAEKGAYRALEDRPERGEMRVRHTRD